MVNGISSIFKVNSVEFIPQPSNMHNSNKQEYSSSKPVGSFEMALNQALNKPTETAHASTVYCATYTYDSDSMYRDFQYHTREYTY